MAQYKQDKKNNVDSERPTTLLFSFNVKERDEAVEAWDGGWTPESSTSSLSATAVLHALEAERTTRGTASRVIKKAYDTIEGELGHRRIAKGGGMLGLLAEFGSSVSGILTRLASASKWLTQHLQTGEGGTVRDPSGKNTRKYGMGRRQFAPGA